MIIRIGNQSIFTKNQENQYVKADIFFLVLPIVLGGSMFVTEKQGDQYKGFQIKPQYSVLWFVLLLYLVIFTIVASVLLMTFSVYTIPFSLALITYMIYVIVRSYKSSKKETFIRQQFFKATGLCLRPEWLLDATLDSLSNNINNTYKQHFGDGDVKSVLKELDISHGAFSLVFCTAYIKNLKSNNIEANNLMIDAYLIK